MKKQAELAKEVSTQFRKGELLKVAQELDLSTSLDTRSVELTAIIIEDLTANGVPTGNDVSDLMMEFLVAAEFIDADGNIIAVSEPAAPAPAKQPLPELPEKLPECFSFADERDAACNRCALMANCLIARVSARPPCYATGLYNPNDEQCKLCLEANNCRQGIK